MSKLLEHRGVARPVVDGDGGELGADVELVPHPAQRNSRRCSTIALPQLGQGACPPSTMRTGYVRLPVYRAAIKTLSPTLFDTRQTPPSTSVSGSVTT